MLRTDSRIWAVFHGSPEYTGVGYLSSDLHVAPQVFPPSYLLLQSTSKFLHFTICCCISTRRSDSPVVFHQFSVQALQLLTHGKNSLVSIRDFIHPTLLHSIRLPAAPTAGPSLVIMRELVRGISMLCSSSPTLLRHDFARRLQATVLFTL